MWKTINTFIVIIAFSVTLEKLNRDPQACPAPRPKKKNFLHAFFFRPPLENLLRGLRVPFYCLISNREGLGTSLEIMGLATIDPHSKKEHTEIHKIPKFRVNQASFG